MIPGLIKAPAAENVSISSLPSLTVMALPRHQLRLLLLLLVWVCSCCCACCGSPPLVQLLQPCRRYAPALVSGLSSCMLIFSSHRRPPPSQASFFLISAALCSICLSVLHASHALRS